MEAFVPPHALLNEMHNLLNFPGEKTDVQAIVIKAVVVSSVVTLALTLGVLWLVWLVVRYYFFHFIFCLSSGVMSCWLFILYTVIFC